jgi:hypothetical protein
MYIMHLYPLSYIFEQFFIKTTFSKFITYKVKNNFELNVFKWVLKTIFINSSPFAFLIINVKILFNF